MYKAHEDPFLDQQQLFQNQDVEIIFDVGAAIGDVGIRYSELFEQAKIFCFEPFEETYKTLVKRTRNREQIKTYNRALSNVNNERTSFYFNSFFPTNSLLQMSNEYTKYLSSRKMECLGSNPVITVALDDFCQENNIHKVDILKMDIQGGELQALQGAKKLLENHLIELIYTEVLFVSLYQKQCFFWDLGCFLQQYDYRFYGMYNLAYGSKSMVCADAIFLSPKFEAKIYSK